MDCKYVRQSNCICYKFHPLGSSIFLLTHFKNRLRIVQQNLLTGLVMNQFIVPLKQQNLQVQNYILNFCEQLKVIILTLYNHFLVYSLQRKTLIFVGQVHGKNPYYIQKAIVCEKTLYFTAADQHNIYTINIQKTLSTNKIQNYGKFKIAQQASITDFVVINTKSDKKSSNRVFKVVGLSTDKSIKVWDAQKYDSLKGVGLSEYGRFTCIALSKSSEYLMCGTSDGYVLGFDAKTIGEQTIMILKQRVVKIIITSLCWFHYSGQDQSKRFLIMTQEGSVKLYSFYFQDEKHSRTMMGKANQLALLYEQKTNTSNQYTISSHNFANFIFFNPGILLFMVDNYPRIYYPTIARQKTFSFDELIPNAKKQVFFQRDYLFIEGMNIKRLLNDIQDRFSVQSVLGQFTNLKVIKLDYRPMTTQLVQKSKILITYYLKDKVRNVVISNINLGINTQQIQGFKEYLSLSTTFLGPVASPYPLLLNLQQNKQTITVIKGEAVSQQYLQKCDPQQRKYLSLPAGNIVQLKLSIKVQKIFQTPFRNNYVVLYLSQNLLRFSRNIDCQNDILDYDVYSQLTLRLQYYDIILEVIWTKGAQFAAVVCLDKVVFISQQLKIIRVVSMQYIIQALWVGYSLIVTTKVDVQYVDIYIKPVQLYCIQNFQSKYLILGVMVDRILSIQKFGDQYRCKSRYFNLMQPLLSGYLAYHKVNETPIDSNKCKRIIQCFAPYHIVSQSFIKLLNQMNLSSFSKYFIQSNMKLYSKSIRALTFNSSLKMERFVQPEIWNQFRKQILELFLLYEQTSDTADPFQKLKNQQYKEKLINIMSEFSFKSISQAIKEEHKKGTVMIANNFGEKSLTQVYFDLKQGQKVPMEIQPFKAQNIGEWIGLFSGFIEAKIGMANGGAIIVQDQTRQQGQEDQQDKPFKDLIVYYRFDQGKGDSAEDLGDYSNNGDVFGDWNALEEEPMQLQDKWGKKCPPQFSITGYVTKQKKLTSRKFQSFSIQTWFKFTKQQFSLYKIGEVFHLTFTHGIFHLNGKALPYIGQIQPITGIWNHISVIYDDNNEKNIKIYINTQPCVSVNLALHITKDSPMIGDSQALIQFTQFRYWKRALQLDEIKDTLRSPLQLVHEKRKKLKMKIKKKKKQQELTQDAADNFFSFPL